MEAIRSLTGQGLRGRNRQTYCTKTNVGDSAGVPGFGLAIWVSPTLWIPLITPKMDGDRSILNLRIPGAELSEVFHKTESLAWEMWKNFCAPPPVPAEDVMEEYPCSAGHTLAYISPYGDVFPCVQFPLPSGNVRRQNFIDIWRHSSELNGFARFRPGILPGTVLRLRSHVGTCTRCPGLGPTWKEICADLRRPTARSRSIGPGFPRKYVAPGAAPAAGCGRPADTNTVGGRLDMSRRNSQLFVHEQAMTGATTRPFTENESCKTVVTLSALIHRTALPTSDSP